MYSCEELYKMEKRKGFLLKESIVTIYVRSSESGVDYPKDIQMKLWDIYPIFHYTRLLEKDIRKMTPPGEEVIIKTTYRIIDFKDKRYFGFEKTLH